MDMWVFISEKSDFNKFMGLIAAELNFKKLRRKGRMKVYREAHLDSKIQRFPKISKDILIL